MAFATYGHAQRIFSRHSADPISVIERERTEQSSCTKLRRKLYGFLRSRSFGALDYRAFGGTIFLDRNSLTPPGAAFDLDFKVPYVVGGRIIWETPLEGLRVGGSVEAVRLDTTAFVPGIAPIEIENHSSLWVGSAEYSVRDLVLTAEYSRWSGKQSSNNPLLSPPLDNTSERGYVMATYRVTPWFQPGAYYSALFPDVHQREGRENRQHDVAGRSATFQQ
jgi:hypothetical protein